MPRGGKRPGAGAPRGNMNNLKHGRYSTQFAALGAAIATNPKISDAILSLGHKHQIKARTAEETVAIFFTRMFGLADKRAGGKGVPELTEDDTLRYDGLNWDAPVDELGPIIETAVRGVRRQTQKRLRQAKSKKISERVNQKPGSNPKTQSNPK